MTPATAPPVSTEDSASPRTMLFSLASLGRSGTAQPIQDIQVLPSLSPDHPGTAQPLYGIQVLARLSRTFSSAQHLQDCQTSQDIQVLASLSPGHSVVPNVFRTAKPLRTFRYWPASRQDSQ